MTKNIFPKNGRPSPTTPSLHTHRNSPLIQTYAHGRQTDGGQYPGVRTGHPLPGRRGRGRGVESPAVQYPLQFGPGQVTELREVAPVWVHRPGRVQLPGRGGGGGGSVGLSAVGHLEMPGSRQKKKCGFTGYCQVLIKHIQCVSDYSDTPKPPGSRIRITLHACHK